MIAKPALAMVSRHAQGKSAYKTERPLRRTHQRPNLIKALTTHEIEARFTNYGENAQHNLSTGRSHISLNLLFMLTKDLSRLSRVWDPQFLSRDNLLKHIEKDFKSHSHLSLRDIVFSYQLYYVLNFWPRCF